MIHIEHFDDEGNARNLDDAGKLRLLASYFDMQDAITGSSEPEIQKDLLRMAERMEDVKRIAQWWTASHDREHFSVDGDFPYDALDRIAAEGAVK